jgi:hypothetical protein
MNKIKGDIISPTQSEDEDMRIDVATLEEWIEEIRPNFRMTYAT